MRVVSRRHAIRFYLELFLITVVCTGVAVTLAWVWAESDANTAQEQLMPFFAVALFASNVYIIFWYFKNSPRIVLDTDGIEVSDSIYKWDQVKSLKLTGKSPSTPIFYNPTECAIIKLDAGKQIVLLDPMYANTSELKLFIQEKVFGVDRRSQNFNIPIDTKDERNDFYEYFKSPQLFTFRGLTLWGLVGYMIYSILYRWHTYSRSEKLSLIFLQLFVFYCLSWMMFYVEIGDRYLRIKNHNLFWFKRAYRLDDIYEVVYESFGRMPNGIRIIKKDFRSRWFPAGTLSTEDWMLLKDRLEEKGIPVRNESVY